jgi:hypothetical protein|tara:strand:+ start:1285 stop:2607 length:1323 start_codon:yes stop_codon:yes gene_type:complete
MKNNYDLRILTIHNDTPNVKSYTSVLFNKILPILKSKKNVHMTWLVCKNEKIEKVSKITEDTTVLDIHDFSNLVDVIQKVKPNLIYIMTGLSAPDYTLLIAAKYFKIPVIGGEIGIVFYSKNNKMQLFKSLISKFFQNSESSVSPGKKQLMGKGRFFIYKHIILLKTQIAIKQNPFKIIKEFYQIFFMYLFGGKKNFRWDSMFSGDLHFLDGEIMIKPLLEGGFKKSALVVTGNPIHDDIFEELQNTTEVVNDHKKIQVLLVTSGLPGFDPNWIKTKRNHMIKKIIREINTSNENINITIKIHPSQESLEEYRDLVHKIDPSIKIYQREPILQLLKKADVIISSSSSTAMFCGLLLKKPLIIHNCFQVDHDEFLERELAVECKNLSKIIPTIHQVRVKNIVFQDKIDKFTDEVLFKFDGKSSERISNEILILLDKNRNSF